MADKSNNVKSFSPINLVHIITKTLKANEGEVKQQPHIPPVSVENVHLGKAIYLYIS